MINEFNNLYENGKLNLDCREGLINFPNGEVFYPFKEKDKGNVSIENMVNTLSYINRWNGRLHHNWSVADHSLLATYLYQSSCTEDNFNDVTAMRILTHDFVESVLGDIPRPVKYLMKDFDKIEFYNYIYLINSNGLNLILSNYDKNTEIVNYYDDLAVKIEIDFFFLKKKENINKDFLYILSLKRQEVVNKIITIINHYKTLNNLVIF